MHRARVAFLSCAGTLSSVVDMGGCALDERQLKAHAGPTEPPFPGDIEPSLPRDAGPMRAADVQYDARDQGADGHSNFLDVVHEADSGAALPPQWDWPLPDCQRLVINDAWIDGGSNCVGIQGQVWAEAPVDSPIDGYFRSDPICIGSTSAYAGDKTLGIHLSQMTAEGMPNLYNATRQGVIGFRFTVSLNPVMPGNPMPFVGVVRDDNAYTVFCMPLSDPGTYEMRLSDLRARCWESSTGPTPTVEGITSLVFYYPRGWPGASVGMCVGDISAIVQCSTDSDCPSGVCRSELCAAPP